MEFDPTVISSIPDFAGNPVAAKEKAITLSSMLDKEQLGKLQLGTAKREEDERGKVDKILKGSDYSTPEGLAKTAAAVNKVSPKSAMDLMRTGQSYQSGQIQNELDRLTLASQRQDLIVGAIDPIIAQARAMKNGGGSDLEVRAFITQQMPNALTQLRGMKLNDGKPAMPDDVLKMATSVPGGYTLETLEGWESKSKQGAAAIKQRLEQFKADTQSRGVDERVQHDNALEGAAGRTADERERHARETEAAADRRRKASEGAGEFGGQVGQVLASMSDLGVALPAGMRAKQQMLGTIQGLIEKHPDESTDQIADRIRRAQLKLGGEKVELATVSRREGSAAAAINSLNRKDGLYDQLEETAAKVDFGSAKFANALALWRQGEVVADNDIAEYVNALADTRAEFASVLSRGGQVTDSVRIAAEHAFPDKMSQGELKAAVSRSKKIADAIQAGNKAVVAELLGPDAKLLDQGGDEENPAGAGGKDAPSPGAAKPSASTGPLQPGKTYKHSSGATIEILP